MNNKEAADSKWRPVTQVRGGKGVKGNYVSRHVSNGIELAIHVVVFHFL